MRGACKLGGRARARRAVHCPEFSMVAERRTAAATAGVSEVETSVFGPPVEAIALGCASRMARATGREPVK